MITRDELIKNREIHASDFFGKRFTPSFAVRSHFLKLFSLAYADFPKKFTIQNISWNMSSFRITLRHTESSEIFDLILRENTKTETCNNNLCTPNICTGVHNPPRNRDFLSLVVSFRERCSSITILSLLKFLASDHKAKKEYYRIFAKSDRPPFSIIQDWGHPLHRMRFIAHEWVFRNIDQSLEFNLSNISIQHSERECLGIGPEIPLHKEYKFFNFSQEYYDHTFDKYFYLSSEERKECMGDKSVKWISAFTDLDEEDIVMWRGTEKLQNIIDNAISQIEKEDIKMMSFNCCCVPRIVGDDIYSVIEKAKAKMSIPFLFQGQLEKTPFEQKIGLLESYLEKIDSSSLKKEPNTLVLFWYHENKYLESLYKILLRDDIRIRAMIVPTIDIRLLPMLYTSSLFLFSPNRFQEEIFEYPFRTIGTKSIAPKYPYGIENTRNWLSAIEDSFWRKYIPSEEENIFIETFNKCWKKIKENGYRLGVVCIGKRELERFLDPDYMNNVDMVECLQEMGFGIDFFVYDNFSPYLQAKNEERHKKNDGDHTEITRIIEKKMWKSDHSITFFSDEETMFSAIRSSKIKSIYSDIYYDERLSSLGLTQFNIRQFNIGYSWALDTIQEMIKLCEMRYFQLLSNYVK